MHQHETLQQNDDERLNGEWQKEVAISNRYEKNRPEFIKMLETFEVMCDDHLGGIKTSRFLVELASDNVRAVQGAPYEADPTARQVCANETDGILKKDITKLVKAE